MPDSASVPVAKTEVDFITLLGDLVRHGSERRGEAVVLMYDEEDGFFISTIDNGCHHHPVKEHDLTARRGSLQEAVIAAAQWHNEKKDESPWATYMARMEMPDCNDAALIEKVRAALIRCHNKIYPISHDSYATVAVAKAQSEFHAEVRKLLHEPMLDERR